MRFTRSLFLALSLLGLGNTALADLKKVKDKGVLKIGVEPGFLPFEMRTPQDTWIGFDVDMMNAFCKKIAVKCEFISSKWDGIIPGLVSGKYDVIASGMIITEDRAKTVLFSDPYFDAGLRVLLPKASKVVSAEELDAKEKKIAVKLGTTGDIYVKKNFKNAQVLRMDAEADAAQAVALGKVDAFVYDQPFLDIFASAKPDKVQVLRVGLTTEQFGLAARKKSQTLIDAFNEFLKEYKADGSYKKSYQANFVELTWKKQFPLNF